GRDVSSAFVADANGDWIGIVDGLVDGDNELVASVAGDTASVTLTNHPINATLLAGPQQVPFLCELEDNNMEAAPDAKLDPLDADCAAITTVEYFYRNDDGEWLPFDPEGTRPTDIATTTTSDGVEAPLIARQ